MFKCLPVPFFLPSFELYYTYARSYFWPTVFDVREHSLTHCTGDNLIGFCRDLVLGLRLGTVEILDAFFVILAELQGIGEAVKWRHDGSRLHGVLQTQDVTKLMSCHLQEVCSCIKWINLWNVHRITESVWCCYCCWFVSSSVAGSEVHQDSRLTVLTLPSSLPTVQDSS